MITNEERNLINNGVPNPEGDMLPVEVNVRDIVKHLPQPERDEVLDILHMMEPAIPKRYGIAGFKRGFCWMNTQLLVRACHKAKSDFPNARGWQPFNYCEGMVQYGDGMPFIEHAWLEYKNYIIDLSPSLEREQPRYNLKLYFPFRLAGDIITRVLSETLETKSLRVNATSEEIDEATIRADAFDTTVWNNNEKF